MKSKDWLTTEQAATAIGVIPRTLYGFINRGEIPAYRMGRVIRIKATDIEAFIEQSRVKPGELEHLYPDTKPNHKPLKIKKGA